MTNTLCKLIFMVTVSAGLAQAQTFTVLHDLNGTSDGSEPMAGVIQDTKGNIYGTTTAGGGAGGTVFKINPVGRFTVLLSFSGPDGQEPWTPVVRDETGNLYGTTSEGGSAGCGTVFKIDSTGNEKTLHSFTDGADGCTPDQGVILDNAGNLYGTTSSPNGTIFKLDSAGSFTLLHAFTRGADGANPQFGHLAMDKSGNLFGVNLGGSYSYGVLYKLSPNAKLTVLHTFAGGTSDGCYPSGSVVQDKAGNFYGTTRGCGSSDDDGIIWRVSERGKLTILHRFVGGRTDGCYPLAGVTLDPEGNLYGVTSGCGSANQGTLYRWNANAGSVTILYNFDYASGTTPWGEEVLRGKNGDLFGTAIEGGTGCHGAGCGTVWKYAP